MGAPKGGRLESWIPRHSIVGRIVFGFAADRIGRALSATISYGCTAAGTLALLTIEHSPTALALYVYALLFGLGFGARGPIITSTGAIVGEHNGFARYTIGQRRGIPGGFASPMYVIAIRPEQRAIVIGTRDELLGSGLVAREVNWLTDPPDVGDHVTVRVRHRAPLAHADAPFQMLVTMLDYNDFVGRIGIGRISNGKIAKGQT